MQIGARIDRRATPQGAVARPRDDGLGILPATVITETVIPYSTKCDRLNRPFPYHGGHLLPVNSPVCWRSAHLFWANALMEFRRTLGIILPSRKCIYQNYEKHRHNHCALGHVDQRSCTNARHPCPTTGKEFHLYTYQMLTLDS